MGTASGEGEGPEVQEPTQEKEDKIDEVYYQKSEYKFHSTDNRQTPYCRVISIEVIPSLILGDVIVDNKTKKRLVTSQLELIAQAPSFEQTGEIILKVRQGKLSGNYNVGRPYSNPFVLEKDLLKLYNRIQKAHKKIKNAGLKLFPITD